MSWLLPFAKRKPTKRPFDLCRWLRRRFESVQLPHAPFLFISSTRTKFFFFLFFFLFSFVVLFFFVPCFPASSPDSPGYKSHRLSVCLSPGLCCCGPCLSFSLPFPSPTIIPHCRMMHLLCISAQVYGMSLVDR